MQQKSGEFSMQDALRLANSPAGQQLLALLQQAEPSAINQVREQAAQGDYSQVKKLLAPLLATEEAKQLIAQLGGSRHG